MVSFHDVEHVLAKPPCTLRIVLLGDSMLAGMQVPLEQSLARRLEALLNEQGDGELRFEVVNCATDGFGTAQAWLIYEARCRRYQPDLVLLGFFATNDGARPRYRLHDVFLPEYSREHEEAWAVTKQLLLAFDEGVRRSGARFGVLGVPSPLEISPDHIRGPAAAQPLDLERPQRILGPFLAEHGVGYLDLRPGLRDAAANGAPLYFQRDMHWTGSGNDRAGALVARWIAARYSRASGPGPAPRPGSLSAAPESSSTTGPPPGPRC